MSVLSVVPAAGATLLTPVAAVLDPASGLPTAVLPTGSTAYGTAILVELQAPANSAAVFTIPANKGFSGIAYAFAQGTAGGVVSLSAATGGVFYSINAPDALFAPVAVKVASQTGTNAVTVVTSGGGISSSIVVFGYFK